jgi:hypothetical protein
MVNERSANRERIWKMGNRGYTLFELITVIAALTGALIVGALGVWLVVAIINALNALASSL